MQADVEQYYLRLGVLFAKYHQAYWVGLQGDPAFFPPLWSWVDPTTTSPNPPGYVNWGTFQPGDVTEPKVVTGAETCGAANFTMTVSSTGTWGWSALLCKTQLVYICRVLRGCRCSMLC